MRIAAFVLGFGLLVLTSGCSPATSGAAPPGPALEVPADWTAYGNGISLESRTPIAEILAEVDQFSGKTVAVEGRIVGVCAMMGCWVELQSENQDRIRLKVDDGEIVFPQEAQGRRAVAQGNVEILDYSRDQYEGYLRHEAEEMGHEFDPASLGDPPYRIVRLKGEGAWIQDAAHTD